MIADDHPLNNRLPSPDSPLKDTMSETAVNTEQVLDWRRDQFQRMGFTDYVAEFLSDTHIDLHEMADLLQAGCSHENAMSILIGTTTGGKDDQNWDFISGRPKDQPEYEDDSDS